jgi:hypothetical protein
MIFVFCKNEGWVLQFRETAKITKKQVLQNMKFAKTKKTWSKNKKFNYFSFNSCEDAR